MILLILLLITLNVQISAFKFHHDRNEVLIKPSLSRISVSHSMRITSSSSSSMIRKTSESLDEFDLVGEEAVQFSLEEQSLKSWGIFGAAVTGMLSFIYYIWIWNWIIFDK